MTTRTTSVLGDESMMNGCQQQQPQEPQNHIHHRISQSRKNYYDCLLDISIPDDSSSSSKPNRTLQLPHDVYLNILEYLPPFPLHGTVERKSRKCVLRDESCQTDAEGHIHARSHHPLPHLQYFRFRSIGFKVGFGVTTNPVGKGGIRLNEEACGFLVPTKCFHFGTTMRGKENLTTLMDWLLRTRYYSTDNTMGIAVDYERNQILMNWPNRQETLRLDLPVQFWNKVLYPMVQVWGGSAITVLPERVMADPLEKPPSTMPREQSSSAITTTAATTVEDADSNSSTTTPAVATSNAPTTIPLTQSISQDSWCSEWISLCKSRGLTKEQQDNNKEGSTTAPTTALKSILMRNRIPIVDELDDRLSSSSSSMTSMATFRTRRAARPHPHGISSSVVDRRRHRF